MSDISSLSELKKQLQDLGLSAATPGLVGEERFKELLLRLHNARKPQETGVGGVSDPALVDNLKQLSMSEIRAQLTELGISTSTPGLSGEDRWNALVQRLAAALAGKDQYTKATPMMAPVVTKAEEPPSVSVVQNREPPEILEEPEPVIAPIPVVTAIDEQIDTEYQRFLDEANQKTTADEEPLEVPDFRENINDMKKILKKVSNKRSMAIAAQLSGEYQDTLLKEFTDLLARVEHDIAHCEVAVTRCEHKIKLSALRSQLWKDHGQAVDIATTVTKLNAKREELKESIKTRRQEIRHAAENHPEYGLQVEEDLKAELAQMQFTTNKVSRARRKLNDTKSIDSQLAQDEQESVASVRPREEDKVSAQAMPKGEEPSPLGGVSASTGDGKPQGKSLGTVAAEDKAQEKAKSFPAYAPPIPAKYRPPSSEPKTDHNNATASAVTTAGPRATYPSTRDDAKGKSPRGEEAVVADQRQQQQQQPTVPLPTVQVAHRTTSTPPVKTSGLLSSSSLSPVIETPSPQQESNDELTAKRKAYEMYLKTGQFPSKKSAEKSPAPWATTTTTTTTAPTTTTLSTSSPHAVPPTTLQFSPVSSGPLPSSQQQPQQQQVPPPSTKPPRRVSAGDPAAIIVRVQPPDAMDLEAQRLQLEIEELLRHAKHLQRADDNLAAEILLERALDMDPMNILVLQSIARFLHVKKGELARAEAFFNRALQVSQPQLYSQLMALTLQQRELNLRFSHDVDAVVSILSPLLSAVDGVGGGGGGGVKPTKLSFSPTSGTVRGGDATNATSGSGKGPSSLPSSSETLKTVVEQSSSDSRFCLPHLLSLLLSFAKFLLKSKGDVDAAALLLQQAVLLAPDHAACIAQYAHFLTEHVPLKPDDGAASSSSSSSSSSSTAAAKPHITQQIDALFQRALQCAPGHCVYMMWYAKFLKKLKRFGPAEFMYRSAWEIAAKQQELAMERRLLAANGHGGGTGKGEAVEEEEEEEEEDDPSQEPTALCNYATFLFKYRPKRVRDARELFLLGVRKYPDHMGLRKNYQTLEKKLAKHPELLAQVGTAAPPPPAQQVPPSMKSSATDEVAVTTATAASGVLPPQDAAAARATPPPPAATMAEDDDAMPMIPTDAMASPKRYSRSAAGTAASAAGVSIDVSDVGDDAAMGPDSPTKQLSGHFLSPSKFPSSRQASRVGSSQVQSRGSRRAQRLQQSLAHQVPSELVTAEEKASFILERVRSANSSASNSTLSLQRLQQQQQQQQQQGSSHNSSVASLRGGGHHLVHPTTTTNSSSTNSSMRNDVVEDSPTKGASLWNVDGFTHVSDHEDDDNDDDGNDDEDDEGDEDDGDEGDENDDDHDGDGDGDHGTDHRRDGAAKATTGPTTKRAPEDAPSKEPSKGGNAAKAASTVAPAVKTKPSEHSKASSPAHHHQPQKASPQHTKKTTATSTTATTATTAITASTTTKPAKKPAPSTTTAKAADGPRGDANDEEMSYDELLRKRPAVVAGAHHKESKHAAPHQPHPASHPTHHSHGKK